MHTGRISGGAAARRALACVVLGAAFVALPAAHATFPGANGKIVFSSNSDGDGEIFTINADGTGLAQLTTNTSVNDRLPAWSADGTKIAYSSTQDGGDFDIWVMNADGSGQTQLTFNSAEDFSPSWSPDGAKIVFDSNQGGVDQEIYVMNADGSGQTQLTSNSTDDHDAAWSPDGATIAFQRFGADFDIWVMNADGSGQTQLTATSDRDTSVSWAPDGAALLFRRDLGFGAGWGEVFRMNPDGSGVSNLTNTATIFEDQGSFSPDGTKIVMFSNEGDLSGTQGEILVMNPDGTGRINLTVAAGYDSDPDWQPSPQFPFAGFFSPVDNLPVFNSMNAGRAVAVKFSLGGDRGLNIFLAGYPKSETIACNSSAAVDGIESTVTAGDSSLSYDPSIDRYTYVWKTSKAWAGTCRQLVLKLTDGSTHRANFLFK